MGRRSRNLRKQGLPVFYGCLFAIWVPLLSSGQRADSYPAIRKIRDVVIYEDARFYAAFPSVIRRTDGEIIVAFRRAPDRKIFGEKGTSHSCSKEM